MGLKKRAKGSVTAQTCSEMDYGGLSKRVVFVDGPKVTDCDIVTSAFGVSRPLL